MTRFAEEHVPESLIESAWSSGTVHDISIQRALAAEGLIGTTWPTEFGGAEMSPVDSGYLWEALNHRHIPVDLLELTEMVAHVIVTDGSSAQQATILPKVRDGSLLISLG